MTEAPSTPRVLLRALLAFPAVELLAATLAVAAFLVAWGLPAPGWAACGRLAAMAGGASLGGAIAFAAADRLATRGRPFAATLAGLALVPLALLGAGWGGELVLCGSSTEATRSLLRMDGPTWLLDLVFVGVSAAAVHGPLLGVRAVGGPPAHVALALGGGAALWLVVPALWPWLPALPHGNHIGSPDLAWTASFCAASGRPPATTSGGGFSITFDPREPLTLVLLLTFTRAGLLGPTLALADRAALRLLAVRGLAEVEPGPRRVPTRAPLLAGAAALALGVVGAAVAVSAANAAAPARALARLRRQASGPLGPKERVGLAHDLARAGAPAEGLALLRAGAEAGDPAAAGSLGFAHQLGYFGLPVDRDEAVRWLAVAAVGSDAAALSTVEGLAGERPLGPHARRWQAARVAGRRAAAEAGDARAMLDVATRLELLDDAAGAAAWEELAAASGDLEAKVRAGRRRLAAGDIAAATSHLADAAARGGSRSAEADVLLGELLEATDPWSARAHYRRALSVRPWFQEARERLRKLEERHPRMR